MAADGGLWAAEEARGGLAPPVTLTPPDMCSMAQESHMGRIGRPNPWSRYATRGREEARAWLVASYAAHTPRRRLKLDDAAGPNEARPMAGPVSYNAGWNATAARLATLAACGTGETQTLDGELVCIVDDEGRPQSPRRRENRCGHRLCPTCAQKWAGRNAAAIMRRVSALDDVESRAAIMSAALDDVDDAAAMEAEALAMPRGRTRGAMLRAARNTQTRAMTRYRNAEQWTPGGLLVVTLTQRATASQRPADETPAARAARLADALTVDMDRLHRRLRALTTSQEWTDRARGWAIKIETTFTSPEVRAARLSNGSRVVDVDDAAENWHVHAHVLLWADRWDQSQLRALWESTRAPGEAEGGRGSVWIEEPRTRGGAVAEVAKYAAKPLDLHRHGVDVGAAWITVMRGRRLLRLGGALDGITLVDDDDTDEVEDNADEATAAAEVHGPVRPTLRTPSGRWVTPDSGARWSTGPVWEESVRAWRERVFTEYGERSRDVDRYTPEWLERQRREPEGVDVGGL